MTPDQRESRFRVIKLCSLPVRFIVTPLATSALLPDVHVILPMTGDTLGLEFLAESVVHVTGLACRFGMHAAQRIVGLFCVIKARFAPPCLDVAGVTARTQHALVHVVTLVAAVTGFRRLFLL